MFKTVLVSQLFSTPGHLWEKDLLSQRIIQTLDLVLHGVRRKEIQSFIPIIHIRTCQKKKKYEFEHGGLSQHQVEQLSIRQLASETLEDVAESYAEEEDSSLANLHKAIPPEFTLPGVFCDVVENTEKEGSVKGLSLFKQRLKDSLLLVPENYLMNLTIGYVRPIFLHAQDVMARKLDYITIPELD